MNQTELVRIRPHPTVFDRIRPHLNRFYLHQYQNIRLRSQSSIRKYRIHTNWIKTHLKYAFFRILSRLTASDRIWPQSSAFNRIYIRIITKHSITVIFLSKVPYSPVLNQITVYRNLEPFFAFHFNWPYPTASNCIRPHLTASDRIRSHTTAFDRI